MTENIKKLLELVSANEDLQDRINKATKEELTAIAKEHGIELSDADFDQDDEVSDEELNAVAGGIDMVAFKGNLFIAEMNRRNRGQN